MFTQNYERKILPANLVQSIIIAFLFQLPGLRDVAARCSDLLGVTNYSSLFYPLSSILFLQYVQEMLKRLEPLHCPKYDELIALDSMAITLPKTQRHNCVKFNDKTVGGGVLWAYLIEAKKNVNPIKILKIMQGAWHDSKTIEGVSLIANGPVYLMDRGFYCFEVLEQLMTDRVRFIMRIRKHQIQYTIIRHISKARAIGNIIVSLDAVVLLGGDKSKSNPKLRLIIATLPSGEDLILSTNLYDWYTEKLLTSYKKRERIERFHRFLKDNLGLAHLYNFSHNGIMFLLHTAVLLAILLYLSETNIDKEVIDILRKMLKQVRRELGLGNRWKRNICTAKRQKKRREKND